MWYRNLTMAMIVFVSGSQWLKAADDPDVLQIGMSYSQVQELPSYLQTFLVPEFGEMVEGFTGCKNEMVTGLDPVAAAKQLQMGKLHLFVLEGIELAWLQAKNPELRPLLVAGYDPLVRRALLVGRREGPFTGFADLKGKNIHVLQSKLHSRLFADLGAGGKAEAYFGKLSPKFSAEEALDDLLLGQVQAAVVDTTLFANYQRINPGRFQRLKILAQSEPFPASVVVYQSGALSDKMLNKLRVGLLEAGKTERIQEMMGFFSIKSFQAVPNGYQQNLSNILKDYPSSAVRAASATAKRLTSLD